MNSRDGFDLWLETELRRRLHGVTAAPVPRPRYRAAARKARRSLRLVSGASAALGAKAATGLVAVAFAVGATGAAITGSPNPTRWAASVHQVVDQCKAGSSVEGIGGCVAAVAQERPQPAAVVTAEAHQPAPAAEPSHTMPPPAIGKPADAGKPSAHAPAIATARPPATAWSPKAEHTPKPASTPRATPRHVPFPSPEPRDDGERWQGD